jgi:hypothetical protein
MTLGLAPEIPAMCAMDTSGIALHSRPILSESPENERYPQAIEKKERGGIGDEWRGGRISKE